MGNVFLDANTFIDIVENRDPKLLQSLDKHTLFVSTSSLEIWSYVYKLKVSDIEMLDITSLYNLVGVEPDIVMKASTGPTTDLEDNIQVHSAVDAGCDIFLTKDKNLLKMGFFGKTRISSNI